MKSLLIVAVTALLFYIATAAADATSDVKFTVDNSSIEVIQCLNSTSCHKNCALKVTAQPGECVSGSPHKESWRFWCFNDPFMKCVDVSLFDNQAKGGDQCAPRTLFGKYPRLCGCHRSNAVPGTYSLLNCSDPTELVSGVSCNEFCSSCEYTVKIKTKQCWNAADYSAPYSCPVGIRGIHWPLNNKCSGKASYSSFPELPADHCTDAVSPVGGMIFKCK